MEEWRRDIEDKKGFSTEPFSKVNWFLENKQHITTYGLLGISNRLTSFVICDQLKGVEGLKCL